LTKIKVIDFIDFRNEFSDLEKCDYGHDPLKVLLDVSAINCDVKDIQMYLQNKGFEVEKTTMEGTILFLFTIGTTASKEGELFFVLNEIENDYKRFAAPKNQHRSILYTPIPKLQTAGLKYFYFEKEELDIADAEGRISSFIVTPYPPGIPVLVPGQTITNEHIDYLERQIKDNRSIHGLRNGKIFVVKNN
jgi:arginine/lysine/ornithine decarboxylase